MKGVSPTDARPRNRRQSFMWMSEGTSGLESVVDVRLEPADGGGTTFRLRHTGLPDTEMARGHQGGWDAIADAITKAVEVES